LNVVLFPLHRRGDLVQELVEGLSRKNHEEANIFWREAAKQLLADATASGVPAEQARDEVRMLFYAALDQMQQARRA
jgi:hypothetical protein